VPHMFQRRSVVAEHFTVARWPALHAKQTLHFLVVPSRFEPATQVLQARLDFLLHELVSSWPAVQVAQALQVLAPWAV